MRVRLAACGMRAISNLVDVTNYVMLETGHPLHAFDLDKLRGGIQIRRANRGERMTTLDGVDRPLQESDVVIADDGGAIALAGVMGGADSEISASTTGVLLETATFDPRAIRRTAKRLGLHSEASHRFERGVDAEGIPHASRRAANMLARAGGGAVAGEGVDRYPQQTETRRVSLSFAGLTRLAGFEIPLAQAAEKLAAIGIASTPDGADAADGDDPQLSPGHLDRAGSRRGGHAHGRLRPRARPAAAFQRRAGAEPPGASPIARAISWPRWGWPRSSAGASSRAGGWRRWARRSREGVVVKNPISADYELMRTSLLPALLDAARRNVARGVADVGLFEVGPVVWRARRRQGRAREPSYAAAILVGRRADWLKPGAAVDFFDGKRVAIELLRGLGVASPRFVPVRAAAAAPGRWRRDSRRRRRCADRPGRRGPPAHRARAGPRAAGRLRRGDARRRRGRRQPIRSVPPPRFPAVTRDVSFWIDVGGHRRRAARGAGAAAGPLLRDLAVLEDYRDPEYAPAGKKGMLWSLTYRADDRTLTDAEVDAAHARVVGALKAEPSVVIR